MSDSTFPYSDNPLETSCLPAWPLCRVRGPGSQKGHTFAQKVTLNANLCLFFSVLWFSCIQGPEVKKPAYYPGRSVQPDCEQAAPWGHGGVTVDPR